jgi:alanine dehydrogenase
VKEGAIIIGWCHAAQQHNISQISQNRKLTLIAMENMYVKDEDGNSQHLFYKNNLIAGQLGVQHALEKVNKTYEIDTKIAVIGFGLVSHGVIEQLFLMGYKDISVFTRKPEEIISQEYTNIHVKSLTHDIDELLDFEIIVNGLKQDILNPYTYFSEKNLKNTSGKLIIDISCDNKIGFDFARSTNFSIPIIDIYNNYYYAVPNIPSLAWKEVSYDISENLLPIINAFLTNTFSKVLVELIESATDIKNGTILNNKITAFQQQCPKI